MIDRNGSPDDRLNPTILHHQIIYLNSELNKYKSKVRDYQEDYHYSQLEKLKIENRHLLGEQQRFTSQLEEINHKNLTLQNRIMEKETLIEHLKKQIENFKKEVDAVSNKLAQAKSNNEESLKEIERHQHTNQQLQNQVSALEKELITQSGQQTTEIQTLQSINERLKEEQTQLKDEKLTLESFQNDMFDKIEDLKREILSSSSGEITGSSPQYTKIEYSKLYQQVEHIFTQINEYGEKISTCVSLTNHLEEHIDHLTDEIKQLKSSLTVSSTHQQTL